MRLPGRRRRAGGALVTGRGHRTDVEHVEPGADREEAAREPRSASTARRGASTRSKVGPFVLVRPGAVSAAYTLLPRPGWCPWSVVVVACPFPLRSQSRSQSGALWRCVHTPSRSLGVPHDVHPRPHRRAGRHARGRAAAVRHRPRVGPRPTGVRCRPAAVCAAAALRRHLRYADAVAAAARRTDATVGRLGRPGHARPRDRRPRPRRAPPPREGEPHQPLPRAHHQPRGQAASGRRG